MKHTLLVRSGGLAAMVCGALYALERYRTSFDAGPPFILLLIAAMLATASIAVLLQRERYGRSGVLASLASFVGLALVLMGNQIINSVTGSNPLASWGFTALGLGFLAATIGLVVLAIVTINARLLPWWGGVALIAGSPFGVLLLITLPATLSESLLEGPWQRLAEALVGVPWVLVGYVIFRAGARPSGRPSRVR